MAAICEARSHIVLQCLGARGRIIALGHGRHDSKVRRLDVTDKQQSHRQRDHTTFEDKFATFSTTIDVQIARDIYRLMGSSNKFWYALREFMFKELDVDSLEGVDASLYFIKRGRLGK